MVNKPVEVHGYCDPKFEAVRDAFVHNFREHSEVGAATSVVVEGETVVDIWAGYMDANKTKPWQEDTIVKVLSATKGIVSLVAHQLVDQGKLDLEAPVAKYWPEFAQAGKEKIPVKYLLTHQAGLPAIDVIQAPGAEADWDLMVKILAEQAPRWEPGTSFGYHLMTFGWLIGEVVQRITGKSVGKLIQEMVAEPLGVNFLLGFGPEYDEIVADSIDAPPAPEGVKELASIVMEDPEGLLARAALPSMPDPDFHANSRAKRAAEIPADNGHTNARALARIYGVLVCGGSIGNLNLIGQEQLEIASSEHVAGIDEVAELDCRYGLGFLLGHPYPENVAGRKSYGHTGFGGSVGLADPEKALGFGYVMNQRGGDSAPFFVRPTFEGAQDPDPRAENILRAVYSSL